MAPRRPYYTSNTLIEAVKRKISMPITQVTFSDEDILAFADEEMMLEQIPSILQYHEEYLVYSHSEPLVSNKTRYSIPARAIGMKLRDLFFRTTGNQLVEMTKVNPDDKSFFSIDFSSMPTPIYYYIQNNSIVLIPEVKDNPSGHLEFTYYLRPNSLVKDEDAAICNSFSKTITVDNNFLMPGDVLNLGNYKAVAGVDYQIGVNSSITAANLSVFINTFGTDSQIISHVVGNIIDINYQDRKKVIFSSNPQGLLVQSTITVNSDFVPDKIIDGTMVDILQTDAGHSTLAFDVKLGLNSVSANGITFTESQLPQDFVVGDYICSRYECIIPQIPTDLHNLLAERTCARILESLGDSAGLQVANSKIDSLEKKQSIIMDNRSEGSPSKVVNKSGILRSNRVKFGRRG